MHIPFLLYLQIHQISIKCIFKFYISRNNVLQGYLTMMFICNNLQVNSQFLSHVCKLKKIIYSRRLVSRAWYNELWDFLVSHCFINTKFDPSLFIYVHGKIRSFSSCLYRLHSHYKSFQCMNQHFMGYWIVIRYVLLYRKVTLDQ